MKRNRIIFSLACIALALLMLGCDTPNRDTATTTTSPSPVMSPSPTMSPAALPAGATHRVADITGNPTRLVGQTVTVVADVEEVLGPRAFQLDEDSALAGGIDNDLLVLSPQAGNLANIDDQWLNNKVRVTGTVRSMVVAEIEREIGWNLQPQIESKYQGKAVLVAKSVERVR